LKENENGPREKKLAMKIRNSFAIKTLAIGTFAKVQNKKDSEESLEVPSANSKTDSKLSITSFTGLKDKDSLAQLR